VAKVTLISLDGIPGSGKSSTARWLAEMLDQKGQRVLIIAEDDSPHPLRFLTDLKKPLAPWAEISTEEFSLNCLGKFSQFLDRQINSDEQDELVVVVDGLLFHTDTTSFFLMQPGDDQLNNHLAQMYEIGNRVRFLPLFLYHQPFGSSLAITVKKRPDEWSRMQVDWKTSSPYCAQMGYFGHAGFLQFYQEYEERITNYFKKQLKNSQIGFSVCNPQDDWLVARKAIWNFYSQKLLWPSLIQKLL